MGKCTSKVERGEPAEATGSPCCHYEQRAELYVERRTLTDAQVASACAYEN